MNSIDRSQQIARPPPRKEQLKTTTNEQIQVSKVDIISLIQPKSTYKKDTDLSWF